MRKLSGLIIAGVLLAVTSSRLRAADYEQAIERFRETAQAEVQRGALSGVSVALVNDQKTLYAGGFGLADKAKRVPAAADTVYRAGSISKLFTALMTMQLAEAGKLNIDAPVTKYLPRFRIVVPFEGAPPITLRQLMCHRSGLVRESPVGGYFDDTEPGIEETVASIADCVLVYLPATKTKYSNIGVTVVGQAAAAVAEQHFDSYQTTQLLAPLGMTNSGFLLERGIKRRLAKGYMAVAQSDGGFREITAPHFELGTLPAGNLYTTAEDLARFTSFLFARGRANSRPFLKPETLAQMFTPQLTTASNGFGLGFAIGSHRGHKTVSHSGAVYGFTSSLIALVDHQLAVIVLANDDLATGPVRKLTSAALDLMLQAKLQQKPEPTTETREVNEQEQGALAGDYESESYWARVEAVKAKLMVSISGQQLTLMAEGSDNSLKFRADGRVAHKAEVTFERDKEGGVMGFSAMNQRFVRVQKSPPFAPSEWKNLIGTYGPSFIPLIVSVKHGHLYAMTENEFDYRLTPLNRYAFKMPPGLYTDEQLVFQVGRDGKAHSAVLANMVLKRR